MRQGTFLLDATSSQARRIARWSVPEHPFVMLYKAPNAGLTRCGTPYNGIPWGKILSVAFLPSVEVYLAGACASWLGNYGLRLIL